MDTPGLEVSAFQMNNKKRWLVKCKWRVGFINRSREFVMDQDQTEWLIANLRPGEVTRLLTYYRDELVRIGAWGVKVEKVEAKSAPLLIAPPPAVVPGNTGPRKPETARLSEPKKKTKTKPKPKAPSKPASNEPSLADVMMLLQTMSSRLDAVEEAATEPEPEPSPASAGPDF